MPLPPKGAPKADAELAGAEQDAPNPVALVARSGQTLGAIVEVFDTLAKYVNHEVGRDGVALMTDVLALPVRRELVRRIRFTIADLIESADKIEALLK